MTTLATPPPATATPLDGPVRMVRVSANLLPDTVVAARRLRKLQRRLAIGLVGLVGLVLLAYGFSWWQTKSAQGDLSAAQNHNSSMRGEMTKFTPLLRAQAEQEAISTSLRTVMTTDVQWRSVWSSIESKAGRGVQITGYSGSVLASAAASLGGGGLSVLNKTGLLPIGTLTITGTATDNKAVAAFVDGLSATNGLASPIPTSVGGAKGSVIFTVNLLLTSDALGGRFTSKLPATATGGH